MPRRAARIAGQCDGVRCDMAMLVLPTSSNGLGKSGPIFWPTGDRFGSAEASDFLFHGRVYWDLEWTLQQQGFDYTYDKRLYDRLEHQAARPSGSISRGLDYQDGWPLPRETTTSRERIDVSTEVHRAAAVLAFLSPGLRFLHQGSARGSGSGSRSLGRGLRSR